MIRYYWLLLTMVAVFIPCVNAPSRPPLPGQGEIERATVLIDPANKQNIMGSFKIANVWGERFSPPMSSRQALSNLREALVSYTKLTVGIDSHLRLGSPALLRMPFVYVLTDQAFELTQTEIDNVKKYIDNGGFIVLDNARPNLDQSQAEASFRKMMKDVLGDHDGRFEQIPNNHKLYHCFFDFPDGPPSGAENIAYTTVQVYEVNPLTKETTGAREAHAVIGPTRPYLEGITYNGRLVAILSNKGYGILWAQTGKYDNQLRMGINMVVFSLIQPGGIAVISE